MGISFSDETPSSLNRRAAGKILVSSDPIALLYARTLFPSACPTSFKCSVSTAIRS